MAIVFAGSLAIFSMQYVTKSLYCFMNKGSFLDAVISVQLARMKLPLIDQQYMRAIVNYLYGGDWKAVGFTSSFKILICEDILHNDLFRDGLKVYIAEHIPSLDIRSTLQGGGLSPEDSNKALDLILDSFQRNMLKSSNFERFLDNRMELRKYYSENFYKYKETEPGGIMYKMVFRKYWYIYVAVGITTAVVAYNVAEPLGQYAVEKVITRYFPPNI